MKIDFDTGRVIYNDEANELKQSLEDLKIKENLQDKIGEAVFTKAVHKNLKYGRLKYLVYCFLQMVDGLVGIVSLGQTQSIIAQKYLLSDWVMGDYDGDR